MDNVKDDAQARLNLRKGGSMDGAPSPFEGTDSHDKKKPVILTARFDGLVDVVERDGESAFLIVRAGQLIVTRRLEDDQCIWEPPPINCIPWALGRADVVAELFHGTSLSSEANAKLFDDLVDFFQIRGRSSHT